MAPGVRKFVLVTHLVVSVGWIGAVLAYLALGVAAVTRADLETVRGSWMAMDLIGWLVIVPLAVAAVVSGIVLSRGTPWGLFRHYWVIISLTLTVLSTVVLVLHMPTVSATAQMVRAMDSGHISGMGGDLFHPGLGLLVLLTVAVLNVYKPQGLTVYGWHKQQQERRRRTERRDPSAAGEEVRL